MILTPHILIGAAIGAKFDNPFLIFILAFFSHFALDAIPHWEYQVASAVKNIRLDKKNLRKELRNVKANKVRLNKFHRISIDLFFGLTLAIGSIYFITGQMPNLYFLSIGIFGALLADGITMLYFNFNCRFVESFQVGHFWIHCQQVLGFFSGLIINILVYIAFVLILII